MLSLSNLAVRVRSLTTFMRHYTYLTLMGRHPALTLGASLLIGASFMGASVLNSTDERRLVSDMVASEMVAVEDASLQAADGGLNHSSVNVRTHKIGPEGASVAQAGMGMGLLNDGLFSRSRPAAPFALRHKNRNDADCLTEAVYYEARGEGDAGMRAVAQVILNRVRHPAYPRTICGVVYQGAERRTGCQFSFTCSGVMGRRVDTRMWKRAEAVATSALSGHVMKAVGSSTHFHTVNVAPVWRHRLDRIATVGNHVFYQLPGRGSRLQASAEPSSRPALVEVVAPVKAEAPVQEMVALLDTQSAVIDKSAQNPAHKPVQQSAQKPASKPPVTTGTDEAVSAKPAKPVA